MTQTIKSKDAHAALQRHRRALPVYEQKQPILDAVGKHQVTIVVGETGSGKTTQVPQFLRDAGYHSIAITQPRRISAISLAQRVALETRSVLGKRVGYSVRFDDMTSRETEIRFMTDGLLQRELLMDSLLSRYDVIILDEAHERTVRTDVLLGILKGILAQRPKLRLLVMSATLESGLFQNFFENSFVLHIPGRMHEIRVFHALAPQRDYLDATLRTVYDIHTNQAKDSGDILAFLTGQEDIESAVALLADQAEFMPGLIVCPLFASLPMSMQKSVFDSAPTGQRKIILSTNIAETSVTIPGVRFVIDNGLAKQKSYNSKIGLESLTIQPISKSSALQRSGRAGREAPGRVYRLYTETTFITLSDSTPAEIKRANLANVVLHLKASGIHDIMQFPFIERPPTEGLIGALQELILLRAINRDNTLSDIGNKMVRYPLEPRLSRLLVTTLQEGTTLDIVSVIALLSVDTVFYTPGNARDEAFETRKKFMSNDGDLITLLNVLRGYEDVKGDERWCRENFINRRNMGSVLSIRTQLLRLLPTSTQLESELRDRSVSDSVVRVESVLRATLHGFFMNIAMLQPDGTYVTVSGRHVVNLHPTSVLFSKRVPVVSFVELVASDSGKWYLRNVSRVDAAWVENARYKQ